MINNRRKFLKLFSGLAMAFPFNGLARSGHVKQALEYAKHTPTELLVKDEYFWKQIRQAFAVSSSLINLNNGGVSPHPRVVREAVEHYNRLSNESPSYYMWRILGKGKEAIRQKLAQLAGCQAEEICINRNATEALETVIFGLRLQAGDEVVRSNYDYPNMENAWKQRAFRDGIQLRIADFDPVHDSASQIIDAYLSACTSATKVLHLTHMINWSGRILPVGEIAKAAKQNDIEVIVDGAHSFAHIEYAIPELHCDYFGASLHKWLCAPFGSGMLYVNKQKIKNLYPLFAAPEPEADDIRKFEHLGTRSQAIEQAIGHAIDFHHMIGSSLKAQRLRYLKNYWTGQLKGQPGFEVRTPLGDEHSGAIALFGIAGHDEADVDRYLFREYNIHTTHLKQEQLRGVRISPNIYTLTSELDTLVAAIRHLLSK
jgi:selenocysteine lyase/cysteine desulfurase